jgi:predicted phosphodiesterase
LQADRLRRAKGAGGAPRAVGAGGRAAVVRGLHFESATGRARDDREPGDRGIRSTQEEVMASSNLWLGNDIKSVAVMSDMHLGASNCVLDGTPDPLDENGKFSRFLEKEIGKTDAFILLGDVYELALATYDKAVPRAQKLIEAISRICESRIVVVPGNHDHYVWTLARDQMEIMKRFPSYPANFLPTSIHGWYPKTSWGIDVAYPNVYWSPPAGGRKSMIFHHGHYCSETYTMISDLYHDLFQGTVTTIDQIEGINSGWLDLVWYHLGQAAGVNELIDKIYAELRATGTSKPLQNGVRQLYKLKLADKVEKALLGYAEKNWWLPKSGAKFIASKLEEHLPGWIEQVVFSYVKDEVGGRGKSRERDKHLDDLVKLCDKYVSITIDSEPLLKGRQLQMIFGHTHLHENKKGQLADYANTGGWITGSKGEWPDSYVFKIDSSGEISEKPYVS